MIIYIWFDLFDVYITGGGPIVPLHDTINNKYNLDIDNSDNNNNNRDYINQTTCYIYLIQYQLYINMLATFFYS